ncbi:MAG: hypothetical protein N4A49_04890 [Marinifilaceae bacterium]|jgi:hypothetical protein|nr:hypothetical protein [Marinifilaceae bacterium]
MKQLLLSLQLIILIFVLSKFSFSQNISGNINSYARVTFINKNGNNTSFFIDKNNIRGNANINDFNEGRRILIYQAKGASITSGYNNSNFGSVTDYGNSGNYEIGTVLFRYDDQIEVAGLTRDFNIEGMVQIISIPEYDIANTTGQLSPVSWDATEGTGGLLILNANELNLNHNINADSKGFRGGKASNNYNGTPATVMYSTNSSYYGEKGESFTTHSQYLYGMSPLASGGGGGSHHNAGGAGGSNYSQGGNGGKGWNSGNVNTGGISGHKIDYKSMPKKIFFGGGGGGAQQNNSVGTDGGNGGGIIILITNTLNSASNITISARGGTAQNGGNDGMGGGGAGGVVIINTREFKNECNLNINLDGGNGGNVNSWDSHGAGGGGGSGLIIVNTEIPNCTNISAGNGDAGQDNDDPSSEPSAGTGTEEPDDPVTEPTLPGDLNSLAPGSHLPSLSSWLIADENYLYSDKSITTQLTSTGSQIGSWKNIANSKNYITNNGVSGYGEYQDINSSEIKTKTAVYLNETYQDFQYTKSTKAKTIFVVCKSTDSNTSLAGLIGDPNNRGIRISNTDGNSWKGENNANDWHYQGKMFINKKRNFIHSNKWHIMQLNCKNIEDNQFYIGGYYSTGSWFWKTEYKFSGYYSEIITYSDALSGKETNMITTYLSLKYGIETNINYTAGNGVVIWKKKTDETYRNDIAGFGKDDLSLFDTNSSYSLNDDACIKITCNNDLQNYEYTLWGNNNGNITATNTNIPTEGYTKRCERIWKLKSLGNQNSYQIKLSISKLGINNPDLEELVLFTNSSDDFSNTNSIKINKSLNTTKDSIIFSSVNLNNNDFFTLAFQDLVPKIKDIETQDLLICNGPESISQTINLIDYQNSDLSAIIEITSNYQANEDKLELTPTDGVSIKNQTDKKIELNFASLDKIQKAIRNIRYKNIKTASQRNIIDNRIISIKVNDGKADSNTVFRTINLQAVPEPSSILHE